jgi:hypothetical protein
MKILRVGLKEGFVLLVGRRGAQGGTILERAPEPIAVANQLGVFGLKVGDFHGLSGDLAAEERCLRGGAEVDLADFHAALRSAVTVP